MLVRRRVGANEKAGRNAREPTGTAVSLLVAKPQGPQEALFAAKDGGIKVNMQVGRRAVRSVVHACPASKVSTGPVATDVIRTAITASLATAPVKRSRPRAGGITAPLRSNELTSGITLDTSKLIHMVVVGFIKGTVGRQAYLSTYVKAVGRAVASIVTVDAGNVLIVVDGASRDGQPVQAIAQPPA